MFKPAGKGKCNQYKGNRKKRERERESGKWKYHATDKSYITYYKILSETYQSK